jgi:hypothetical protein
MRLATITQWVLSALTKSAAGPLDHRRAGRQGWRWRMRPRTRYAWSGGERGVI